MQETSRASSTGERLEVRGAIFEWGIQLSKLLWVGGVGVFITRKRGKQDRLARGKKRLEDK